MIALELVTLIGHYYTSNLKTHTYIKPLSCSRRSFSSWLSGCGCDCRTYSVIIVCYSTSRHECTVRYELIKACNPHMK